MDDDMILAYTGDFSLEQSVSLAAGALFVDALRTPNGAPASPCLDLAIVVEGSWHSVGVRVTQAQTTVNVEIHANPSAVAARVVQAQIERMLSLDVDGNAFWALGADDPVLARLIGERRGVRPLLYASPYEGAARAIIGQRLFVRQAAAVTNAIAVTHGARLTVGDRTMHAFPEPKVLAKIAEVRGLAGRKLEQLRALGVAAVAGKLDSSFLRSISREEAMTELQRLPGIGPFSAELILLRGVGDPDAFPLQEKRLHRAMAIAYHLGDQPTIEALVRVAERWRPYRTWAGLLLRNSVYK